MTGHLTKIMASMVLVGFLGGCATDLPPVFLSKKGAVELRAMQSRAFESSDRNKIFRGMIATFQDLGYSIMKVEPVAGTVTADKLAKLKMTATVYPRGKDRMIVRSNAVIKQCPGCLAYQVDAPKFYQQRFFEPLSKAIFLQALQIEDADTSAVEKAAEKIKETEERARLEEETRKKQATEKAIKDNSSEELP